MNETWPEIKKRKLKERRGETFDWIQSLVIALFACVLLFTFIVRVISVVGTSMLNTLHPCQKSLICTFISCTMCSHIRMMPLCFFHNRT